MYSDLRRESWNESRRLNGDENSRQSRRNIVIGWCVALVIAWLLTAGLCAFAQQSAAADTTVRTESGLVSGVMERDVRVFRGIPFAQPPVGPLRWRAPKPAAPWNGIRPAREWGHPCMQVQKEDPGIGPGVPSEDCLTLNVFAPNDSAKSHPVMVYIYGGAFIQGAASAPQFDGTFFAQHGIVLVTCNYRLGHFGFFAHPALTKEAAGAPVGNYGFMDQIAALHWVRDNIASFGGDPGRVTIFGESAGGISVINLMISPAARGLFHAAIAQSSFGRERTETLAQAEKTGTEEARRWGAASQTADALRKIPAGAIVSADATEPPFSLFLDGHVPIIDGKIVPEPVMAGFRAGHEAAVPFIIGVTARELPHGFGPASFEARVPAYAELPQELRSEYGSEQDFQLNFLSEAVLTEPAFTLASYHALRAPTYLYRFGIASDATIKRFGAAPHGSELAYLFQTYAALPDPTGPRDTQLGAVFAGYWISFGTSKDPDSKDPNSANRPPWPRFANDQILTFTNDGPKPCPDPIASRLRALEKANDNGSIQPVVRTSTSNNY